MDSIISFMDDEKGVTAIEYGLLAALVAIALVVGVSLLGTNIGTLYNAIASCFATPTAAVCSAVP
jgi:pilus assembly protein Flp/PilA